MRFLQEFVSDNFDEALHDILEPGIWATLTDAIYTYQEKIRLAEEAIPEHGPNESLDYRVNTCPECLQDTVPDPDDDYDDNRVRCRFCATVFHAADCDGCGDVMLYYQPIPPDEHEQCSFCMERRISDD